VITTTGMQPRRSTAGPYRLLYEYLEKRYADTVVLTLQQVQDLLGFTLPDLAHTDAAWWANTGGGAVAPESLWSDAWTLANRTARPNLRAGTVIFERVS
jgi:hypothetical protein